MRVAINIVPLKSAHKERGIGYYTTHLLEYFKKDSSISVQEFVKLSEVKSADVIHYPWFDLFFHTLPLKRPFPTIVTIHDVIPLKFSNHYPLGLKGKINFFLQKLALKTCKFVITDSKASKDDIVTYLGVTASKIEVIPLAVDPKFKVLSDAKLIRVKRKYYLPDRFLLYVGDCGWSKNLPFLIKGFNEIVKNPNFEDVKLILVGGMFLKNVESIEHPELRSLKILNSLIKEYGLENKVLRPGQIEDEDLIAFYNLTTAYVQPSLYEGFGLPILQAFASGAPVVTSNRGSLPEVGGDACVYFDPADLNQLISILKEILEDKSLRVKLSKLGLEQVKKFSWDKVISETKSVYEKVIKND